MLFPEDRWEPWPVDVRLSGGPETVAVVDEDALAELPRSGPVGFAPPAPRASPSRIRRRGSGAKAR